MCVFVTERKREGEKETQRERREREREERDRERRERGGEERQRERATGGGRERDQPSDLVSRDGWRERDDGEGGECGGWSNGFSGARRERGIGCTDVKVTPGRRGKSVCPAFCVPNVLSCALDKCIIPSR